MIVIYSADCFVILEDQPLVFGVWVCEVFDKSFPEADWLAAVHEIDEHIVHLINCGVLAFHDSFLPAFTPPVISFFGLFWTAGFQFKITDLDLHFVRSAV